MTKQSHIAFVLFCQIWRHPAPVIYADLFCIRSGHAAVISTKANFETHRTSFKYHMRNTNTQSQANKIAKPYRTANPRSALIVS